MKLRQLALLEGLTLLVLILLAVPLKYLAHWPLGVRIVGPIHGLAFLVYCWSLIESDLPTAKRWHCFFGAFLPGAVFFSRFRP